MAIAHMLNPAITKEVAEKLKWYKFSIDKTRPGPTAWDRLLQGESILRIAYPSFTWSSVEEDRKILVKKYGLKRPLSKKKETEISAHGIVIESLTYDIILGDYRLYSAEAQAREFDPLWAPPGGF